VMRSFHPEQPLVQNNSQRKSISSADQRTGRAQAQSFRAAWLHIDSLETSQLNTPIALINKGQRESFHH
jgi:hypothetical protein